MSNDGRSNGLGGRHGFLGFVPAMVIKNILDQKNLTQTVQQQQQSSESNLGSHMNKLIINNAMPELPIKQELRSVVMFADISGFTNLTESYSKIGPEGNEIIAFAINRYMELMVQEIGKSGGDIFKFAGDAMIVVWPPPPEDEKKSEYDKDQFLLNSCHLAVQSAMNIQKKLKETKIVDQIMLSVKIGFGIGDFSIIYVGGVLNRAEYLPAGNPLIQAFESESHAEKGGVVIISEEVEHYLKRENYFDMTEVTKKDDKKKFFQVLNTKQKVRNVSSSLQIKDQLSPAQIEIIRSDVERYIPKALKMYINLGLERWSSELRWLTVLFMNIGIDLNDTATSEGLNRIQKVIECIQKCVYLQEGSLNKFLMDDKGSTMIVVFGLPPTSHEDDAARACLCAQQIYKSLKLMNCQCSIGIASGLVFAGVVGTSGNRREYSVIGDSVNLSARIMSCACKEKEKRILVDESTAKQAMNKIDFKFWDWKKFKGKSMYLPIYEPLFISNEKMRQEYKDNYFPSIRTHRYCYPIWNPKFLEKPSEEVAEVTHIVQNKKLSASRKMLNLNQQTNASNNIFYSPRPVDGGFLRDSTQSSAQGSYLMNKHNDEQKKQLALYKAIVLCEDKYQKAYGIFKQFMKGLQNQQIKGKIMRCKGFAIIKGPIGVGKSLFLRKLLLNIQDDINKKSNMKFKYEEGVQIIVSSMNSKTQKYKCNGMRKAIKTLFKLLMKRQHITDTSLSSKIKFLYKLIPSLESQTSTLQITMKQLFGLEKFNLLARFDAPPRVQTKDISINVGEDSDERIKNEYMLMAQLVREFFSAYLEQKEHADIEYSQNLAASRGSFNPKNFVAPLIIVLEDIHNYDVYSFKMIRTVLKYFDNIQFFVTARTNYFEKPVQLELNPKAPTQEDIYNDGLSSIEELLLDMSVDLFQVIELSNFSYKETEKIRELLRAVLNIEHIAYKDKIERDESEDLDFSAISYLFFSQMKERLKEYPNIFLFHFLQFKTLGNPLILLDTIDAFLESKQLLLAGTNITQDELEKQGYKTNYNYKKTIFITEEMKNLMLCEEFITINSPIIKRKIYGPILDQLKTEELLIMKIASVIGNVFDLEMLNSVQPFKELIKNDSQLIELLTNLEQSQFIEVLEHTSNNIYFRCSHPFIREVIYQRMDFSQRRQIHINVAENIQTMIQLEKNELQEQRRLTFHLKLSENNRRQILHQDEKQIELKAKRAIIVKRVTNLLKQSGNRSDRMCVLHSGIINKKSDRGMTWAGRYVILTVYDLRYYHDIKEFEDSPQECLASILLKDIITFDKTKEMNGQTQFLLHAEKWYKKDLLKNNKRDFIFSSSEEGIFDEWQIYIEYAKTFWQFNFFTQNFGKISLPLEIPSSTQQQQLYRWVDNERRNRQSNKERSTSMRLPRNIHGGRLTLNKSKLSISIRKLRNIEEEPSNEYINNTEQITLNKERVKTLIYKGLMLFMSHIAEMSILTDERYKKFGQSTQFHCKNPKLFKIDREYLFQNFNPLRGDSTYIDRSRINKSSSEESHEEQPSLNSDKSNPKRSVSGIPKEILTEIKEEEEDNMNKQYTPGKKKSSDLFYAEETAASHQPSNSSTNLDINNQMNSQRNIQKPSSVTTKYSNNKMTLSGGGFESSDDNEIIFNQSSIDFKSPLLEYNPSQIDNIQEIDSPYKLKPYEQQRTFLPSVKEVESNDSSVMSNQIRKNQNRHSSYDKPQFTQNLNSVERRDTHSQQNTEDNQFGKQQFTSSSKSGDISNNPGNLLQNISSRVTQQSQNEQNNQIYGVVNDNISQQYGGIIPSYYFNNQNQPENSQIQAKNSLYTNNSNNNLISSDFMLKEGQISSQTLPSQQGSTATLMNEHPNFLASHSPLVLKKVRQSQWNNIPLMNLEHSGSNPNLNIQDISMIYQNPSGSDNPSPQKEDLTRSEQSIYQFVPSPPNYYQKEAISLQSKKNNTLSDPNSPTRTIVKQQSSSLPNGQTIPLQLTSNFLEYSNSPTNQNYPQGVISQFKDSTSPISPLHKQNEFLFNQNQLLIKQLQQQQQNNGNTQINQQNGVVNNNLLQVLNPQTSLYSFSASPTHIRSPIQSQQQPQQLYQLQDRLNTQNPIEQNAILSLQHINTQNSNPLIQQLSSQFTKTISENIDFSPQAQIDKQIDKVSSLSGTNGTIKSFQSHQESQQISDGNNIAPQNKQQQQAQQQQQLQQQQEQQLMTQQKEQQQQHISNLGISVKLDDINSDKQVTQVLENIKNRPIEKKIGSLQLNMIKNNPNNILKIKLQPSSDQIQNEEMSLKRQSQIIQQEEFCPSQSNEIYSFNMKGTHSEQPSPTNTDQQPILLFNKQHSIHSNMTCQFKESQTSFNQIGDNSSSQNPLECNKQENIQESQRSINSSKKYKPSHFSTPFVVSEANQKALTRQTTKSIKGEKFILAKSLQVILTKFYSDDTVEVQFEGLVGIFLKKDFIFLKENDNNKNKKKDEDHSTDQTSPRRKITTSTTPIKQNRPNIRSASLFLPQSSRMQTMSQSPPPINLKYKQNPNVNVSLQNKNKKFK